MLNRSASLAMSTSVPKALPGKLDIKRHSPSFLYIHGIYISHTAFDSTTRSIVSNGRLQKLAVRRFYGRNERVKIQIYKLIKANKFVYTLAASAI